MLGVTWFINRRPRVEVAEQDVVLASHVVSYFGDLVQLLLLPRVGAQFVLVPCKCKF